MQPQGPQLQHHPVNQNNGNLKLNLSTEHIYSSSTMYQQQDNRLNSSFQQGPLPPPPPVKPGWRGQQPLQQQQQHQQPEQEVIPNDSLYGPPNGKPKFGTTNRQQQNVQAESGMAAWSSHGYLAKGGENKTSNAAEPPNGYVVLKRHGDGQMVTEQQSQSQPQSLPFLNDKPNTGDRKYFSVRGFSDMRNKHNDIAHNTMVQQDKYYSVDARYHGKVPQEVRTKLKENIRQAAQEQVRQQKASAVMSPYQTPPYPPYPHPPPAPPPRPSESSKPSGSRTSGSSLQNSKKMGGSVSWLEWTQQLQAYVAWVNSQLRKRPDLKPVQDLRSDLQSGEVLAQLIEIICKYLSPYL